MTPETLPTKNPTPAGRSPLTPLTAIPCPTGWDAWLWKQPAFPLPEPARSGFADHLAALLQALAPQNLHGQLFLQSWKLSPSTGNDIVSKNLPAWRLQRGLGIWPGRPLPGSWTEESLMNAAAAAFQGDEPQVPLHYLLQLQTAGPEFERALAELSGRGPALALLSSRPIPALLTERLPFYQAHVPPRFKRSAFFLPLLDSTNLPTLTENDTQDWLGQTEIYLRESAEDQALLLLAKSTHTKAIHQWATNLPPLIAPRNL